MDMLGWSFSCSELLGVNRLKGWGWDSWVESAPYAPLSLDLAIKIKLHGENVLPKIEGLI